MSLFDNWLRDLEARHLANLHFGEVSRALRALSSTYVERRGRLREGAALTGAGKRAAFALFYGPLHFITVREIVGQLDAELGEDVTLVDLGCGTGAAGAAWGVDRVRPRSVLAIDRHPWALAEAARTYRDFGLSARTRQDDLASARWPAGPNAFVAAFAVNELTEGPRDRLLTRLVDRARRGDAVLVIEPLARFVAPWWQPWTTAIESVGGRADEWRFRVDLPAIVAKLDRAAGLDHHELTSRSLWIAPRFAPRPVE